MTPEAKKELEEAGNDRARARDLFDETSGKAHVVYEKAKGNGTTDLPFQQWVYNNYAAYRRDEENKKKAENIYETVYARTQGKIDKLDEYQQHLKDAMSTTTFKAGYVDSCIRPELETRIH